MRIQILYFACFLSVFANLGAVAQQAVYDSKIVETATINTGVIRIMLKGDCTIVTKIIMPKTYPIWVCCDSAQYIEDVSSGKKYYITDSDIGFVAGECILETDENIIYQEVYPPLPEDIKRINISSGKEYYVTNFEVDTETFHNCIFEEQYYLPIIDCIKNYNYNGVYNIAKKAVVFCDRMSPDNRFANLGRINTILGLMHYNIADYHKSIQYYTQSLNYFQMVSNDVFSTLIYKAQTIAPVMLNIANCYMQIGNYSDAIRYANESTNYIKNFSGEESIEYVQALLSISIYYSAIGDYNKSIQITEHALSLMDSLIHDGDAIEEMLISAIDILGNSEGAIEKLEEYRINRLFTYASLLNNCSAYYRCIGDTSKSKEYLNNSVIIKENLVDYGESFYTSYVRSKTDLMTLENCNIKDILSVYNETYEYFKSLYGDLHPEIARISSSIAGTYFLNKDYKNAIKYNTQSLYSFREIFGEGHPSYLNSLLFQILIKCYYDKDAVLNHDIMTYVNKTRSFIINNFKTLSSVERNNLWQKHNLGYLISILPYSNDNEINKIVFQLLLFTKHLILSADTEFDKVIRESGNILLAEKFEEMCTIRAILDACYNKPIVERPMECVDSLERRAEVLEAYLLAESKQYADFTRQIEIEWKDVQSSLREKDVAIEILAADSHIDEGTAPYYAAYILRSGWDAPRSVKLCRSDELQTYLTNSRGIVGMYEDANSHELYDLIWGRLADYINDGDNIYFSPAGLLHQINVEALQNKEGKFACEKYNIFRVSSTRELCFRNPNVELSAAVLYGGVAYDLDLEEMISQSCAAKKENQDFFVRQEFNSYSHRSGLSALPATKVEVENISQLMKQYNINVKLYKGVNGNEESFKNLSGKKIPIIHLATHGFFYKNESVKTKPFFLLMNMEQEISCPDNSMKRSGLMFAGAQKVWSGEEVPKGIDDGVLLAQEIASMDLAGTDLVVLSACETGLGEITSEGVFGLQRAFKRAGVRTLIMSLWKVDDTATQMLMTEFYKNLLDGKTKRESLLEAQRKVRNFKGVIDGEGRDFSNPKYWAGFIMLDGIE